MSMKFTVFDKETAKEIKDILTAKGRNFSVKKKGLDRNVVNVEKSVQELKPKKKRGRKKMSKEEKEKKKANRSEEEKKAMKEKMAKLRALRKQRAKK